MVEGDHAESEPDPDPFTAIDHVYAEPWPSEAPPPWHPTAVGQPQEPTHTHGSAAESH